MKRPVWITALIFALVLSGCALGNAPASTPKPTTGLIIIVPSPTIPPSSTPRRTVQATQAITSTVELPTATPEPETVSQLPEPGGYSWQLVVNGLSHPTGLVNAGDKSGRLFIIEQTGLIRIIKDGKVLQTPFLDLTQKVSCCGERGLLGLVFHPKYAENGYFYVDYTEKVSGKLNTIVARYTVSATDPNQADPTSEMRLLSIEQPFTNHNGGQLQFGPEGYLYIGMGDGGSEGDPNGNGQSLQTLLGKILRIDVDHTQPYAIPPENPFAGGGGLWEIWAYGLRNPWRFSFDQLTGDLYLADVGQDTWEEIDYLPAGSPGGENFGWNYYEGSHPYRGSPPPEAKFTMPVTEYDHSQGVAVIGGYVYRGENLPAWRGVYFYGDYGSGKVWGLLHLADGSWQNSLMFETGLRISSFGADEAGEIYLIDDGGQIFALK